VIHARGYDSQLSNLSECLRDVGAEVIAKGSQGTLIKTDIARGGTATTETGLNSGDLTLLRFELEEKTKALKALQRNYDSVSSVGASDREELQRLRSISDGQDRELHELRKESDRLKQLLAAKDSEKVSFNDERNRLEHRAQTAERRQTELQDALKEAKENSKSLQELLRK